MSRARRFTDTITIVVKEADHFEMLVPAIGQLGSRHEGYGVKDEHYVVVKQALLGALGSNLGDRFAGGTQEAWSITYDVLAEIMKKGQQEGPVMIPGIGA
ncbi:MAG: globin domain-containing protein [Verrucomicrobiales bacterium]